jgi:hypothetical protein
VQPVRLFQLLHAHVVDLAVVRHYI